MPCPLYHQISQRTDCKYSKGKRGEWRETRKLTIKVKTRSLEILLSTHTYSKPLLVLCIRLLLHHWRKLSKIMQIQASLLHSISVFRLLQPCLHALPHIGRDCCRLSRCSDLFHFILSLLYLVQSNFLAVIRQLKTMDYVYETFLRLKIVALNC